MTKFRNIQALRVFASLQVLLLHASFYAHERLDDDFELIGPGILGVDVFFAISGFVVAPAVLPRPGGAEKTWRRFATQRVIRIVPLYWVATSIKVLTLVVLPGAALHAAL